VADIETRISRAKASLVIENPFIASIVCSMPFTVDDTIWPPTLQTNGPASRLTRSGWRIIPGTN
jgi:hypothetical protein